MRYCGSKKRFMKYLLPYLTKGMDENTRFVDLFGGGMNVVCEIPSPNKIAVDCNKYVIALWKELQKNGMTNIPTEVTEKMYLDVKQSYINEDGRYEDYIIGYVGTCCSYGSSWFNGYARYNPNKDEDHIGEAYNSLKKQVENFKFLKETKFIYSSYEKIDLYKNDIVYCDPPYFNTKKYESDFCHKDFYKWLLSIRKNVKSLYISEYWMPEEFKCIWSMKKKDGLGRKNNMKQNIKVEKLFIVK